jgi:hypothetical protein
MASVELLKFLFSETAVRIRKFARVLTAGTTPFVLTEQVRVQPVKRMTTSWKFQEQLPKSKAFFMWENLRFVLEVPY